VTVFGSADCLPAREAAHMPDPHTELLESIGFRGGLIVVAGFDRAESLVELARPNGRVVHGLSKISANVTEARRKLHEAGLAGSAAATHWSDMRLPYAEDFVNLLFVEAGNEIDTQEELYDLEEDPFELNNLAQDPARKETLTKFRAELENWIARTGDDGKFEDPEALEEMERLWAEVTRKRRLGHAGDE